MAIAIDQLKVRNFKSLKDVTIPLAPLTVLVGPNSSGKSNCLEAFRFLRRLSLADSLPPMSVFSQLLATGAVPAEMEFTLYARRGEQRIQYDVKLGAGAAASAAQNAALLKESLLIGEHHIIDVKDNHGEVRGVLREEIVDSSEQPYHSSAGALALKFVGDIGSRNVTRELSRHVRDWMLFDLDPKGIKERVVYWLSEAEDGKLALATTGTPSLQNLLTTGAGLNAVLIQLSQGRSNKGLRDGINQLLQRYFGLSIDFDSARKLGGRGEIISIVESDGRTGRLHEMSDGTLRLIAYCVMVTHPEPPPLVFLEEPERNLHPKAIQHAVEILQKLSQRTQVIVSTHSAQLLDTFSQDDTNVLLVSKPALDAGGTRICSLRDIARDNHQVSEWCDEFGMGSAIFHSGLIPN